MMKRMRLSLLFLLVVLTSGGSAELLIYYPMDEGQGSTVVNAAKPGTKDGGLTGGWSTGGKFGGGVTTGSGAGVTVATGALPDQMTMMMWVNGSASGYAGVFSASNYDDGRISVEGSVIEICPDAGDCQNWSGFSSGTWQHWALTRSGGTWELFLNGASQGTKSVGGSWNLNPLQLGYGPDGGISGTIDEFALFDEVLDSGTITDLMNNGVNIKPTIQFDSAESGALESVSPALLTVTLDRPAEGQSYGVSYAVTGGTATSGDDYTLSAGTLSFSPGQTSKTIGIQVVNDGADEDDETIEITLSNPTGPDVELGEITKHTYTIQDPRPGVGFDASSSSGPENAQIIHRARKIDVALSQAVGSVVKVDYAAVGGTAGRGSDYDMIAGTLTFAAGEILKSVELTIIDDKLPEGDETVVVALSNPVGAKMTTKTQHTYTILDNDTGAEPPEKDLNGDGSVDFKDLAVFVESWLECTLNPPELCWE